MTGNGIIVFDMDGVLVEVSESFRETICRTVEHFTGKPITRQLVQQYKNQGGFNNDWLLSQRIASDLGANVPYDTVVDYFQKIFYGEIVDGVPTGLMARERWIPAPGLLEGLSRRHRLSIFTGRLREEANMTLRRFAPHLAFHPLVGTEDVANGKPAPDGLLKIREMFPGEEMWYIGDTVDDARSARAAGVPFVGIAAAGAAHRDQLLVLFEQERAVAVLDDVNQLPGMLMQ